MSVTVTFHFAKNYGAFLQAWALQRFIGESNTILDFNPGFQYIQYYVGKRGKRLLPFFWRLIALWRYLRYGKFDERNKLRLSRKYFRLREIIKNPPETDIYIVGSDQVWNCKHVVFCKWLYFLEFGSPNKKRIAYAISIGMKEWPSSFIEEILPQLKKFHAISVREESTVSFFNSIGIENVVLTCDPTILHTAYVYRCNFSQVKYNCSGRISVYLIYNTLEKNLISMQQFLKEKDTIELKLSNCNKNISVSQWLHNIDTSDAVITDSFHGTVFSILFHKQFVSLLSFLDGDERLFSLLKKVKLEYRLLNGNETKEKIEEILYRPIDWEDVDKILEEWRIYSASWLRDALKDNNK